MRFYCTAETEACYIILESKCWKYIVLNAPWLNSVYQHSTSIKEGSSKGISGKNIEVDGLRDSFSVINVRLIGKQDEIHWIRQEEILQEILGCLWLL